jgi:hypothetical protein
MLDILSKRTASSIESTTADHHWTGESHLAENTGPMKMTLMVWKFPNERTVKSTRYNKEGKVSKQLCALEIISVSV